MADESVRSDDRVMVALAYLFGILVALLIWATQKDRSRFVRFHSLQAIAMDLVIMLFAFISAGLALVAMSAGMAFALASAREDPDAMIMFPAIFPLLMMCMVFPLGLLGWGLRLWGAIGAMNNPQFRFPIIAGWVERFLEDRP